MASQQVTTVFTQDQFDAFAEMSGDDNPIHVDPEFSARTKFGRTVAHGMMLFGFLSAEVARLIGEPFELRAQELSFRAPTFAGEPVSIRLERGRDRISESVTKTNGARAAIGWAMTGPGFSLPLIERDTATYRGMEPGLNASRRRTFTAEDVAAYLELTDDPNPHLREGVVPPALLGGMISHLLGVELPGPGTNWLRQRFVFHRAVSIDTVVEAEVTVARLRPDKGLVDLSSTCSVDGETVVAGQSLVWATDVASR